MRTARQRVKTPPSMPVNTDTPAPKGMHRYRQSLPPLPLALWQAICHGTPPSRPEGCDRQVRGNMRVGGDRICHPQNESCSAARKENVAAQHDRKQASCAYSKKKKTLTWTEAVTTPPRPPSPLSSPSLDMPAVLLPLLPPLTPVILTS